MLLKKRQSLKNQHGDKTGDQIHLISHSIVPIVVGAAFLWMYLAGW